MWRPRMKEFLPRWREERNPAPKAIHPRLKPVAFWRAGKTIFFILTFLLLFFGRSAFAQTVNLRIEGPETTILDSLVSLPETCEVLDSSGATSTFDGKKAICALQKAEEEGLVEGFSVTNWGFAFSLDSINGISNASDWSELWIIRKNFALSDLGIDGLELSQDDELLLTFGPWPMEPLSISFATTTVYLAATTTISSQTWDDEQGSWQDFADATIFKVGEDVVESGNGQLEFTPNATGTLSVWVESLGKTRSKKIEFQVLPVMLLEEEEAAVPSPSSGGGSGGGGGDFSPPAQNLDVEKAIQFLSASQNPDGSIGNPMFTDWVAIGFGAYNLQHAAAQNIKAYLVTDPDPGESLGSPVLSFIRRAMALMALGINPYSGAVTNYIQKIVDAFDASQIGDENLVNDDIFALLLLGKAGYNGSDEIIQKTSQFILAKQNTSGSWEGVDMTAAGIQALSLVPEIAGVSLALSQAEAYLQGQQKQDGGFGNQDSTSWVMQAIAALGKDWKTWVKNGKTPGDYLYSLQKQDGSLDSPTPVWSTAYAIPAALGKPWGVILNSFSKQEILPGLGQSSAGEKVLAAQEEKGAVQVATGAEDLETIAQHLTEIAEQLASLKLQVASLATESAAVAESAPAPTLTQEQETVAAEVPEVAPLEEEKIAQELSPQALSPFELQEAGLADISRFLKIPVLEIIANKLSLLVDLVKRSFWSAVSEIRQRAMNCVHLYLHPCGARWSMNCVHLQLSLALGCLKILILGSP